MRGLLVKDIELMKQQKQFFILVIVMGIILNLTGSGSVSFATGYFTIITAIFAITTMSYDEFDNGFVFLMTLPVSRKQYVAEKYILGIGLTGVAWGVATIEGIICKVVAELHGCLSETIIGSLINIPIASSLCWQCFFHLESTLEWKKALHCNCFVDYYYRHNLYSGKNNGTIRRSNQRMAEWT